jgi:hypothetical protein
MAGRRIVVVILLEWNGMALAMSIGGVEMVAIFISGTD